MRKTSYYITFAVVTILLVLNILSARRADWLVVHYREVPKTTATITYGLYKRCEVITSEIPGVSQDYECRPFPASVTDHCEKENKAFCAEWTSAGYLDQMSVGFGALSLMAILFGVSTHSRRRRIWRAVAGLVMLQAACQIATFGIITDAYRRDLYPSFDRARPGPAYIVHTITWVFGILTTFGVVLTGISANAGQKWAAGNRPYHPITGGA